MINFTMTQEQYAKFNQWVETQPKFNSRQAGDIGAESFQFIFTRTNCGPCLTVKNTINGEELDLTDYDAF